MKIRGAALGLALMTGACSGDDSAEGDTGSGTTAGLTSTGTSSGSTTGTSAGTSGGTTSGTSSSTGEASGGPTESSGESSEPASESGSDSGSESGGSSSDGGSTSLGVCGLRGEALVFADSYEGWEEYYVIGDEGLGEELCVVRFNVRRVAEAPPGCTDCLWTHEVEYSEPQVLVDTDGVCARSELALDDTAIAEIAGQRHGYGYIFEYIGHASYLMLYDVNSSTWRGRHYASWDDELGDLLFDYRLGACTY